MLVTIMCVWKIHFSLKCKVTLARFDKTYNFSDFYKL